MEKIVKKSVQRVIPPLLVLIILINLLAGCAATQKVKISSEPLGATVFLNNVKIASTPAVIKLSKKEKNNILRFEKEGYLPVEVALNRNLSGWRIFRIFGIMALYSSTRVILGGSTKGNVYSAAVGFVAGSGAGLVYGLSSGDFYKLSPSEVNVIMAELKKQGINLQDIKE